MVGVSRLGLRQHTPCNHDVIDARLPPCMMRQLGNGDPGKAGLPRALGEGRATGTGCACWKNTNMRIHVFATHVDADEKAKLYSMASEVLQRIAEGTNTDELVVAVYFLKDRNMWRGELVSCKPVAKEAFAAHARRHWYFVKWFPVPDDLPEMFAFIRIALGLRLSREGPVRDRAGALLKFRRFEDHLAFIFAHELHHFRRHHLGLHPGQGELSADRWAVEHVSRLGYGVELLGTRSRRKPAKTVEAHVPLQPGFPG